MLVTQYELTALPAARSLLIAGGIGIAPILAMAKTLHSHGAAFDMHYCGRSVPKMAFVEELTNCACHAAVHLHVDDGTGYEPFDAKAVLGQSKPGTQLYRPFMLW